MLEAKNYKDISDLAKACNVLLDEKDDIIRKIKKEKSELIKELDKTCRINSALQAVIDKLKDGDSVSGKVIEAINEVYEPLYTGKFDEWESLRAQNKELNDELTHLFKQREELFRRLNEAEQTSEYKPLQDIYVLHPQVGGGYAVIKKEFGGYMHNYWSRPTLRIWTGGDNFYGPEYVFDTEEKAYNRLKELYPNLGGAENGIKHD